MNPLLDWKDKMLRSELNTRFFIFLMFGWCSHELRETLLRATIVLSWDKTHLVGILSSTEKDAFFLDDNWQAIASRLQDLLGDNFRLQISLGTPEEYEDILIVQHVES